MRRILTLALAAALTMALAAPSIASGGAVTANGWHEGEEIHCLQLGVVEGVTERGENDVYWIGSDRIFQANVFEFVPGEDGYSPYWNVNVVHTNVEATVDQIVSAGFASSRYPEVLFDNVDDILEAAYIAGLVTVEKRGVVVHCPILSENGAEAPGTTQLSEEDFAPFDNDF